jgi:non-canonical (house-cleaning) NTP pyrophosphatase
MAATSPGAVPRAMLSQPLGLKVTSPGAVPRAMLSQPFGLKATSPGVVPRAVPALRAESANPT